MDLDARLQPGVPLGAAAQHVVGVAERPGNTVAGVDDRRFLGRNPRLRPARGIELQNFLVLEVQRIDRGENLGVLTSEGRTYRAPRVIHRLTVRPSKWLKDRLRKL